MWHLITHSYTSDLQQALRNPQEILFKTACGSLYILPYGIQQICYLTLSIMSALIQVKCAGKLVIRIIVFPSHVCPKIAL